MESGRRGNRRHAEAAKKEIGVSIDFLHSMRDDPRATKPMLALMYPLLDQNTLTIGRLIEIAKHLRVFSHLSRSEEIARYRDTRITRAQWLECVSRPPTTTTHFFICLIKPDILRIDGVGSYTSKLLKGTSQSGPATDFVCHSHSYSFNNLVSALEMEGQELSDAERKVHNLEQERKYRERKLRKEHQLAKKRERAVPRKEVIARQTHILRRHGVHYTRAAAHQGTSRFEAGFGLQKKRICVPKPLGIKGGRKKSKERPQTAPRQRKRTPSRMHNEEMRPSTVPNVLSLQSGKSSNRPSTAPLGRKRGQSVSAVVGGRGGRGGHGGHGGHGGRDGRGSRPNHNKRSSLVSKGRKIVPFSSNGQLSGNTEFLPQTSSPQRLAPPRSKDKVNLESLWHAIHVPSVPSAKLPFDPAEAFDDQLHETHPLTLIKQGFRLNHKDLDKVPRGRFKIMLRWAETASWSKSPFAAFDAERQRKAKRAEEKIQEKAAKNARRVALQQKKASGPMKRFNLTIASLKGSTGPLDMKSKRTGATKKLMARYEPKKTRHRHPHLSSLLFNDSEVDEDKDDNEMSEFVPTKRFYWIDVFALNPSSVSLDSIEGERAQEGGDLRENMTSESSRSDVVESSVASSDRAASSFYGRDLRTLISSIGRTVLVVAPLIAPTPLRRARCVWELYLTVSAEVDLVLTFPKEEHDRFHRKLIPKFNKLVDIFCSLHAKRTSDYQAHLHLALRGLMLKEGHTHVNDTCRNALTMFLLQRARNALQALINDEKTPLHTEAILLCNQFGHLLMHGDKDDCMEAEVLLQRALKDAEEVNGVIVRPRDVVSLRAHLAHLLMELGKFDHALIELEKNLEGARRVYGEGSTEMLETANSYASLLTKLGKGKQAEMLYRQSLTTAERAAHEGYGQGDDMIHMFARENVRTMMNDESGSVSSPLRDRVRTASNHLVGKVDQLTLRATNNLALLQEADVDLGIEDSNFDHPIKLYRRVLAGQEKLLGVHHPSTHLALFNLAKALYHKSEKSGDKLLLVEAEHCARLSLEGYTQFNLISDIRDGVQLLGNILKSLDREKEAVELADKANFVFFCGRLLLKK